MILHLLLICTIIIVLPKQTALFTLLIVIAIIVIINFALPCKIILWYFYRIRAPCTLTLLFTLA